MCNSINTSRLICLLLGWPPQVKEGKTERETERDTERERVRGEGVERERKGGREQEERELGIDLNT